MNINDLFVVVDCIVNPCGTLMRCGMFELSSHTPLMGTMTAMSSNELLNSIVSAIEEHH